LRPAEIGYDASLLKGTSDRFVDFPVDRFVRRPGFGKKRIGQLVSVEHRPSSSRADDNINAVGMALNGIDLCRILVAAE